MIPIYKGFARQYGHGLGSVFKKAMKTIKLLLQPLFKTGVRALKHEGVRQGKGAVQDLMAGAKPKDVVKKRGAQMLKTMSENLLKAVVPAKKAKRTKPRTQKRKLHSKVSHQRVKKSRPLDIFDQK
ncbi:hypothetical protein ACF0H5_004561 [Mactra antiquata]